MLRFRARMSEVPGSRFGEVHFFRGTAHQRIAVPGILSGSAWRDSRVQVFSALIALGCGVDLVTSDAVSDKFPTTGLWRPWWKIRSLR